MNVAVSCLGEGFFPTIGLIRNRLRFVLGNGPGILMDGWAGEESQPRVFARRGNKTTQYQRRTPPGDIPAPIWPRHTAIPTKTSSHHDEPSIASAQKKTITRKKKKKGLMPSSTNQMLERPYPDPQVGSRGRPTYITEFPSRDIPKQATLQPARRKVPLEEDDRPFIT